MWEKGAILQQPLSFPLTVYFREGVAFLKDRRNGLSLVLGLLPGLPVVQGVGNGLVDGPVFRMARAFHMHWREEAEEHVAFRANLAQFLDLFASAPGVGLECQGHHRNTCLAGQLDADGVEVFGVNVFAPMLLLKSLVRKKKLKNPSSVVFTASISGYTNVAPANGVYGASKSALTAYMKYAALELASKGVRCNSVHPGRIQTPLIENRLLTESDVAQDMGQYPLKRYGKPEEVAYAIAYLLSDAAAWVTGTSLVIDGGRSLK